jgi:hypothetical protein
MATAIREEHATRAQPSQAYYRIPAFVAEPPQFITDIALENSTPTPDAPAPPQHQH